MANDWQTKTIRDCEARLRELGALGDGDDSLRLMRVADAVNGLASVFGIASDLHTADPDGIAAMLRLIGDELARCNERAMIDMARRAA